VDFPHRLAAHHIKARGDARMRPFHRESRNSTRILIGFNACRYPATDYSMWIAGNPLDVLATSFGKTESLFERLPRSRVFISLTKRPPRGKRALNY
jgi:hypothetical protein